MEKDEYRDQQEPMRRTGGMTGDESGLQANNLSPRGQGQPKKKKKKTVDPRVVMQPYQEPQMDSRYNQFNQPAKQGLEERSGGMRNQAMPGRTPLAGVPTGYRQGSVDPRDADPASGYGWGGVQNPQYAGENAYARQAYQTRTTDPFAAGIRNAMATPLVDKSQGPQVGNPFVNDPSRLSTGSGEFGAGTRDWQQRNGGFNPQMPEQASGLHEAYKQSIANGYTDIQDTNPWQTGPHMGQLQGFNTQGWGSGERGSGTLKNRFGQIASRYDVTQPGALQTLMQDPQFQEMTGGQATIVPHPKQDLIDFDGPDGPMAPIDVIGNATEGGAGQNWWWGPTDEQGGGPQAPANQVYNQALTMPGMDQMPQGGLEGFDPQQQQGQAMQFLQWLLSQQQQGNMTNGGLGDAPMF